ncbi:Filamentous hemagglutinin-like protein [Trichormus variabilis ATCC 29413]|uniref:Filamentous hemagglutinin-like protein n=1 Tax=Trichormus variabilis (strain ATCC 29413 / PCC 7937) TaxID=240292 RepID=Q3M6P4_TRIV2|nr:filamentous hemagglutinin N-terminal domain-containing protein [Trichormus variabilis]ABA23342.1 Filamentous hemagglutinin-like protein [Trichormus variabilis ATCC 29413]
MTQNGKGSSWQLNLVISLTSAGVMSISMPALIVQSAFAQSVITPDQTLGNERSEVSENYDNTPTELVRGGAIRGNNLFHSFLEFNVNEGRSTLFVAPNSSIQNIFVRVTGNNRSDIFGKLETSGVNANLFVINPNGIFFGPNARLNIGGSFVASTASGIQFGDRTIFSATSPQPLLTMSVPTGLQFGRTGGEINLQGELVVPTGKTLAFVGGNVTLDGGNVSFLRRRTLKAESGQIAIGGILEVGTVGLNLAGNNDINNQILSFSDDAVLGNVFIQNQARVDVSGQGAGYIEIKGKQIGLTRASQVLAETEGSQSSRGIFIQAEKLTLDDGSQVTASVNNPQSTVSGGNVTVKASDSVRVTGIVPNNLERSGNPSGLFTRTAGKRPGGNLTITTGKLIVEDGGNISARTSGNDSQSIGGTIKITASELVKLIGNTKDSREFPSSVFAQTLGAGNAGSVTIDTPALFVQDGAVISAGTQTNSQGNGGNITIKASDFIEISGSSPIEKFPSGLFARSRGSGNAGSILITTGQLNVRDLATVTVETLGTSNAGEIKINATRINLYGKANLNATTPLGNGGNINLQIDDQLLLRRGSFISTRAGTTSGRGNGGNININIPNGFIVAVPGENSDITANAFQGQGGNVSINAFSVFGIEFREKDSPLTNDITASSEFGLNGTVEINTPEVQPNQGLINLPTQPVEPQLAQVCQAAAGRNQDSFTITGRGGLPNNPNELLYSDAVLTDWVAVSNVENIPNTPISKSISTPTQTNIVEATGWVISPQGEVVLTVNTPNTKSPNSWQKTSACNS